MACGGHLIHDCDCCGSPPPCNDCCGADDIHVAVTYTPTCNNPSYYTDKCMPRDTSFTSPKTNPCGWDSRDGPAHIETEYDPFYATTHRIYTYFELNCAADYINGGTYWYLILELLDTWDYGPPDLFCGGSISVQITDSPDPNSDTDLQCDPITKTPIGTVIVPMYSGSILCGYATVTIT
jgi:hypothetical protein